MRSQYHSSLSVDLFFDFESRFPEICWMSFCVTPVSFQVYEIWFSRNKTLDTRIIPMNHVREHRKKECIHLSWASTAMKRSHNDQISSKEFHFKRTRSYLGSMDGPVGQSWRSCFCPQFPTRFLIPPFDSHPATRWTIEAKSQQRKIIFSWRARQVRSDEVRTACWPVDCIRSYLYNLQTDHFAPDCCPRSGKYYFDSKHTTSLAFAQLVDIFPVFFGWLVVNNEILFVVQGKTQQERTLEAPLDRINSWSGSSSWIFFSGRSQSKDEFWPWKLRIW